VRLRFKLIFYLVILHAVFAVIACFLVMENRLWLFAVEGFFLVSFIIGTFLVRSLFRPVDLVVQGSELLRERDFTTRFRKVGHPELDRLIEIYNDMIDRLRSERLLLEERNFFLHKILQVSPMGIVTFDYDGRIDFANPGAEKLLLVEGRDIIGKKISDLDTHFALQLDNLDIDTGKILPFSVGRRIRCYKSRFMDRGFPRNFLILEELTHEIRISEKSAYQKLIRMMSHEVSNSVGAVNSLLESCLNYRDQIEPEDVVDFEKALKVAMDRSARLNDFMQRFAEVVRLPVPTLEKTNVPALLGKIATLFDSEFRERGIDIRWEISGERLTAISEQNGEKSVETGNASCNDTSNVLREKTPAILLDRDQMEQVLINIVKNAIEAIAHDGTITFRWHESGTGFSLEIEDTGCGITPDVSGNLFSPFFSTKENGKGLGLILVQEILNRHGFEFFLESDSESPTRFTIFFPGESVSR
jgi:signal transduction histidine kinase